MEAQFLKFPEFKTLRASFEKPTSTYIDNINNDVWQEPRMFTLKQLRDTFFGF